MKERPILFSGAMVCALLSSRKTQTRRPVKGFALKLLQPGNFTPDYVADPANNACPYGRPGDWLWVRETWQHSNHPLGPYDKGCTVFYRADYLNDPLGPDLERSPDGIRRQWRPSIHMPRTASRIALEIMCVRVERLQDISDEDCIAEGVGLAESAIGVQMTHPTGESMPRSLYRTVWERLNGPGSWDVNPWVWVVKFRRAQS